MKKRREKLVAIGGSSLLVIFAALCLVFLAILSFSTVQAEGRLGNASALHVQQYYQADAEAEKILAELRNGVVPEQVKKDGGKYIYQCKISDTQVLEVVVQVAEQDYLIEKWQAVSTTNWTADEQLKVWGGEVDR